MSIGDETADDGDGFPDRHRRYAFLVYREIAGRIIDDPGLVELGREHLDRFAARDPRQRDAFAVWDALLKEPASTIAARLTERSADGDYLRETAPAFGALPGSVRQRLLLQARSPLKGEPDAGVEGLLAAMRAKVTFLTKDHIGHLIRAAAGVTRHDRFVLVGTGAVIAREKHVALDLMHTREIDVYVDGDDAASDLIDGSIGEGSPFDVAFGYYAHGVGPRTACLPNGWDRRAKAVEFPHAPGVTCLCPDATDIAVSKLCAWRDKDRAWLAAGIASGLLDPAVLRVRAHDIADESAPPVEELRRRLETLTPAPRR